MLKLEYVRWVDSYGCSAEWSIIDQGSDRQLLECESVGWLLHETEELITIAPHVAHPNEHCDGQSCGEMTIPKAAILCRNSLQIL